MPSPAFQAGYPFAFRSYTGNGATTTFSLPFPYLAQAHIKVYVNDMLLLTGYSFPTAAQVQFAVAPANGAAIVLRRETPVQPLVNYTNAAALKASNLNVSDKQALYVIQEVADVTIGEFLLNQELLDARDIAVQAAVDAATALQSAIDAQELAEAAAAAAAQSALDAQAVVDALLTSYDVAFSVPYLPGAGETVGVFTADRGFLIPATATGSTVGCPVAGSQELTGSIFKNNALVGTFSIPASATSGSLTVAADITMTVGDVLSIKVTSANPSAAPSFGLTFKATLDII